MDEFWVVLTNYTVKFWAGADGKNRQVVSYGYQAVASGADGRMRDLTSSGTDIHCPLDGSYVSNTGGWRNVSLPALALTAGNAVNLSTNWR